MEITDFLLARIAEDEKVAGAADALGQISDKITTSACDEFADHIARHDPARVFAECQAKRRIVAFAERAESEYRGSRAVIDASRSAGLWLAVACLAEVHVDHPDYEDGWRL